MNTFITVEHFFTAFLQCLTQNVIRSISEFELPIGHSGGAMLFAVQSMCRTFNRRTVNLSTISEDAETNSYVFGGCKIIRSADLLELESQLLEIYNCLTRITIERNGSQYDYMVTCQEAIYTLLDFLQSQDPAFRNLIETPE
jgi:hypothetical protein